MLHDFFLLQWILSLSRSFFQIHPQSLHSTDFKLSRLTPLPFAAFLPFLFFCHYINENTLLHTHTHKHKNEDNCCPFLPFSYFHTITVSLLHVPLGRPIVIITQDASEHNRPFDRIHSELNKKPLKKRERKGEKKPLIHLGKERFQYKSDVPVIAADLTRCHYHNSFYLSTVGVLTHGGEIAFSWVSGTQ